MTRPRLARAVTILPLLVFPSVQAQDTAAVSAPRPAVSESTGSYISQGRSITVERFEPAAPGKYPAVLVLHGSGGMTLGGPSFRESARKLARKGYVAHVVHYFELTGTRLADKPTMKANFAGWMRAVADGITYTAKQPNVDPQRIGLLGFSLGGYLSVSVAMYDPRVAAVVEYFGGLPDVLHADLKSLPPTLILHGDRDLVVPVAEARTLEKLCVDRDVPHEVRIYPGQGHGFTGPDSVDAADRVLAFFETHVKQSPRRHEVARPRLELIPGGEPKMTLESGGRGKH